MSKRILLFSDSHGNKSAVDKIFKRINNFDKIIFAGDGATDVEEYSYLFPEKFAGVVGNCDIMPIFPEQAVLNVGGAKILVIHGHRHNARYGLDSMLSDALKIDADAVFYGHTHRPKIDYKNGIVFMNGGALSNRQGNLSSYIEIEIASGNIFGKIVKIT